MSDPAEALVFYVVFVFSVTFHEAAHAYVAMRGGDLTAYHGGQVSLSPLPHMRREPIGMLVLPIVTTLWSGMPFGFASAPYDPAWAERHPRRAPGPAPSPDASSPLYGSRPIRKGQIASGASAPSAGFARAPAGGNRGVFRHPPEETRAGR